MRVLYVGGRECQRHALRYKVPIDAVDTHRPKPKGGSTVDLDVPLSTSARQYLTPDVVEDPPDMNGLMT